MRVMRVNYEGYEGCMRVNFCVCVICKNQSASNVMTNYEGYEGYFYPKSFFFNGRA